MTDEQARAALISETLAAMKTAIALREQAISNLVKIGWTVEQAINLEGACDRVVRRWLAEDMPPLWSTRYDPETGTWSKPVMVRETDKEPTNEPV